MQKHSISVAQGAVIAALYVVLTIVSPSPVGLFQLRFSEALTVLPMFFPSAVTGLFVGCLVSNLLFSAPLWDVVFGSLATLVAAYFTYLLRKKSVFAGVIPPIAVNTLVIPPVLMYVYGFKQAWHIVSLSVLCGEIISCGVLGYVLYKSIKKVLQGSVI